MASGSCKRHAHLQQALCLLVSWVSSTHRSTNPNLKNRALGNSQWHTPHSDVCLVCFRESWAEVHPRRALPLFAQSPCTVLHSFPHIHLSPWRRMFPSSFTKAWKVCDPCLNVSLEHHHLLRRHAKILLPNRYPALPYGIPGNPSFLILAPLYFITLMKTCAEHVKRWLLLPPTASWVLQNKNHEFQIRLETPASGGSSELFSR